METLVSISMHHNISTDDAFRLNEIFSDTNSVVFSCIKDREDLKKLSPVELQKMMRLNQSYQLPCTSTEEILNNINNIFEYQRLKP